MAVHQFRSAAPQPDLPLRAQQLVRGECHHHDVDRLFLAPRDRAGDSKTICKIGDFVTHRGERDRGTVLKQTSDVLLGSQTFLKIRTEGAFTLGEIRGVADANLRVAGHARKRFL